MDTIIYGRFGVVFWLHLAGVMITWVAPFWFNWKLTLTIYASIMIQYKVFGKCVANERHGLSEEGDNTFYAHILELIGFNFNRSTVKFLVRRVLYFVLAAVTIYWQIYLGNAPMLF